MCDWMKRKTFDTYHNLQGSQTLPQTGTLFLPFDTYHNLQGSQTSNDKAIII